LCAVLAVHSNSRPEQIIAGGRRAARDRPL
jgi:hypothetical protein